MSVSVTADVTGISSDFLSKSIKIKDFLLNQRLKIFL